MMTHPVRGIGPNQQNCQVWDLMPDDGGPPRLDYLFTTEGGERVERDPTRYRHYVEGEPTPPRADAKG
jgi:hypothetical protein